MPGYADHLYPDEDVSGLLAWVDDDGRMFAVDANDCVVEVTDESDLDEILNERPQIVARAAPLPSSPLARLFGVEMRIDTPMTVADWLREARLMAFCLAAWTVLLLVVLP
jgi:hypothetical protein